MLTAKGSFFLLFYALSFTISTLAEDVPINDFEIGTQKELSLKRNAFAYFKFRITEITPKYDLSIIAHPQGDNDPELFLATGNQYPSKREDSAYFSTSVGYSSIYIPSADIQLNTDYYLGVSCASEVCDFNLTVDYAQEYYMREYIEDVIIDYVDGGTVVARVFIPPKATIHHILFAAEVENQVESDQSLHMYVNKGNEIPSSSKSDIVALAAWRDGKAAIIYSDDQQRFCTNCNYTIVIEAPRRSKVIFRRTLYGDQIPFDLNDERNDAVELGANVTYAVNISQFDIDVSFIIVEVIPYFGKTKVLANLGTLPAKYSDYAFNLTGYGQELLFIPVQAKPANNLLYVTVDGTTYSTYSIRIYSMNKKNMVLKLGEPEVGYILNEEIENFFLTVVGRKNMKMTFSLHPEQGKVNLFVKTCTEKANCLFTKDETQSILNGTTPTSIKTPILQFAKVTAGDDSIEFDMDGSVCEASSSRGAPVCYFAVGVLGASAGSSKFTLTASRADLPQALRVSRTVKEHLSVDQYKYYYFTVTDDTNIESVNFQITKISGSVDIYISRKTKYPDSRDKEEFHHYNDFYSFERSHFPVLNGTYYIAIKGFTSATYSIVPIIKYNTTGDDLGGHHMIKLREGVPQKIVIDNLDPAYFKFEAAVADVQAQGIEVSLDEVQGHFVICAGTGPELPAIGRCQFESNTTTLIIEKGSIGNLNQGDTHFDPMATYLVAVFPKTIAQTNDDDDDDAKPVKPKVQSFSITWAGLHTYRTISFGLPWMNKINKDRVIYYKIEAFPGEDKEIVIHRTTDASSPSLYNVNLYLANRETKLGHNVSVFSPDRTLTTGDTLKLKETDINTLCEDTEGNKCYLFLAAATDSDSEISYTLTITKDFDDLRISESVQATYTFPSRGHPIHLYYYPHRLEDITILSHTYGRNITLYANVINTRDHSSRSGWIFPTNRTYEFISKSSVAHAGESRLFIPAGELSSCGADYDKFRCGIALTLYYDVPQDVDDFFKDFALFSIMANQEVTPIAAGKPIHTSVNEGTYAYFSLYVNKDEATLLVSANVLSGKHVVILASKGKDARPTMDNAEFRSYYGKMETLQVSGDQTVGGTAKGYWVIAVYGYSETEFVLTVLFEKTKMVELHRGLPLNLDVNKDPVYFEYYHESNSSFVFKFAKERGNGKISIKTFGEGEAIADGLPTEFRGDIVRPFEYFQNVIEVSNKSEAFCSKCMYVVGIFPRTEMKISVVAQLPGQFIFLQDNMIFTDSASSTTFNKYEYISYPDATLDINLVVYSGEPHIFVSHNPTVNTTHYLWKYTNISSNNYIRMRLDNSPYSSQASLDPIFDGTKNVSTFKNVFFIMITAPINTNYSLAVSISNSTRVLVDGHLDFGFLNPGEFNLYKYHVSKDNIADNSTNRLKLQFTLHKDKFTALTEELTRPDIVVMSVPHKSYNNASINPYSLMPDLPVLVPIRDDQLEKAFGDQHYTLNLQYVAAADQDFYIVVNNTKSTQHLNYSIVANSHEPLFLTMNNFHAARTAVGESEVYAVHADNKGLLVIEIHECMGRVRVETSNTRNFMNPPVEAIDDTNEDNNDPPVDDETFNDNNKGKNAPVLNALIDSSMGSQIRLASINIEQEQTVYIVVTATEGLKDDDAIDDKEAVYKIRVNLHPLRNFMPFKSLSPGMDGTVVWDVPSFGKVRLGFSDVQNTAVVDKAIKTAKFGNLNITYKYEAFVTKHPVTGKFMARCDMLPKKQGYFKSVDLYQQTIAFDRENLTTDPNDENMKYVELDVEPSFQTQYATIRVTALGVDSNGNAVWDYPIIYKTTEFKNGMTILGVGSQTFLVVLLIVCVIMLIAAVIGLYYYYTKFQRVKAKLNYEMQDLRNMTNVVESFDMLDDDRGHTKAGYAGLMEENNM